MWCWEQAQKKAPCPKYCHFDFRLHFTCRVNHSSGSQALVKLGTFQWLTKLLPKQWKWFVMHLSSLNYYAVPNNRKHKWIWRVGLKGLQCMWADNDGTYQEAPNLVGENCNCTLAKKMSVIFVLKYSLQLAPGVTVQFSSVLQPWWIRPLPMSLSLILPCIKSCLSVTSASSWVDSEPQTTMTRGLEKWLRG